MAAGEQQQRAVNGSDPLNNPIGTRRDLIKRFSAREAVAKHLPAWMPSTNFDRPKALILAVIPLDEVVEDLGSGRKAGEFAGSLGALQRACKHASEVKMLKHIP